MKDIEKIIDYKNNSDLLIDYFQAKEQFEKFINIFLDEFNELETASFEIAQAFNIETAENKELDVLGKIQGLERNSLSDSVYRKLIKSKIIINNGSGEAEIIFLLLRDFYGATNISWIELGNANVEIRIDVTLSQLDYNLIQQTLAAGVKLIALFGSDNGVRFRAINYNVLVTTDGIQIITTDKKNIVVNDIETKFSSTYGISCINNDILVTTTGDSIITTDGREISLVNRNIQTVIQSGGKLQVAI